MNILHVVNISFVIPYFLGNQLSYFNKKGYKEYIVCSSSPELESFSRIYGFEYKEVEILRKISVMKDFVAISKTMQYIKSKQIDIVVGHTPKGALIAMIAAFILRVPVRIYFRHGLVYETSMGFKRKLLISIDKLVAALATKIVCVSPSLYKKSIDDKLNLVSKQVLLSKGTCNGIDVGRFNKENLDLKRLKDLKDSLGIADSSFVVGYTGRLVRDKGIVELVKAFQILTQRHDNMVLLLVGMMEERDSLPIEIKRFIQDTSSIINTGYVLNSIIEYYYALMNIFVFPSYREGFGMSTLEASSMELPIITARVTGCVDSIIEEQTGVFVEHTPECIINAIERFYSNEKLRLNFGKNGRNFVVDNFEQHVIWTEIEKLYQ